jgi:hypothetical protein
MRHSTVEGRSPADAAVVLKEESSKITIRKQHHDSAVKKESVSMGSCLISEWWIIISGYYIQMYFPLLMV